MELKKRQKSDSLDSSISKTPNQSKEKRVMVNFYLTEEEKKRVEEEAKKLGISVSSYTKVKLFGGK